MQGLTEVMFRRVYEECFPGAIASAVSPFISLTHGNLADAWKKIDDVWPESNLGSMPVVPQILGKEPEEFVELGNRLFDVGYPEINWNIGCPMRAITGKHRGSGILPYPDEVHAVLDSIIPRLRPQLSIKMRLGLRSKEEILELVPVLNDYPLSSITIHPRTGRQMYSGEVDLDAFGRVMPLFLAPVIYNGDICTKGDAERIKRRFPSLADIMVGRGVLYRPTLPLEIAGATISDEERIALSRKFIVRLMQEIKDRMPSEQATMRKMKEYWCLLWKSLPISETQARVVLHEQTLEAVEKTIWQLTQ